MSEKNDKRIEESKEEKVVTKYDRKMERRKQEKEKEERSQKISRITGIVVLAAIVVFILSFPIRNYLAVHQTYIKVNGEKVTQVEYDYYFGLAVNSYYSQYGAYLSYFGIDLSGDLSQQMYSDTLTMKDYFDMNTVETLKQNKAVLAQAKAEGFTYDVSEMYDKFVEQLKETAAASGQSVRDYVKEMAGDYATLGRVSKYIKDTLFINEYCSQKEKEFMPADEEVENYYQENKNNYDSFDFRLTTINAELPTQPTALAAAEPVYGTDGTYTPSDAEIEKAMEDAKKLAEAEQKTVAKTGEESKAVSYSGINTYIREWMVDEGRKAGDTEIFENTASNCYYVVAFEQRYLDTSLTADARVIFVSAEEGEGVLNEWKSGEATEESFIALCNEKSLNTSVEDGLYEGLSESSMNEEITKWLFEGSRQHGDTTVITLDDYSYVIYYVGQNDPSYQISIRNTIMSQDMDDFIASLRDPIVVEDPKGKLNYLAVQASQAAEEEEAGEQASEGNAESQGE